MARKRVLRRQRADQDVVEQVDFYAEEGDADTALRFLDAVEAACKRLAEYPEIGPVQKFVSPRLRGLRLWFLPDFPEHLVFYRLTDENIELVRILHAKRDLDAALDE